MEKDNCEMDQEQIMLQEFREAAFKYLVFLETQFSCKDIEAFEDASYSAPIDKSKIFKVIEPKDDGTKSIKIDQGATQTANYQTTMKVLNNYIKKKYTDYHPGKKVPEKLIDHKFQCIIKRYTKFRSINQRYLQSSLDEVTEMLKIDILKEDPSDYGSNKL